MCWVIPPASPAATSVSRIASSSEVLPWSTWPMIVTTGGRVTSCSSASSNTGSSIVSSSEWTISTSVRRLTVGATRNLGRGGAIGRSRRGPLRRRLVGARPTVAVAERSQRRVLVDGRRRRLDVQARGPESLDYLLRRKSAFLCDLTYA